MNIKDKVLFQAPKDRELQFAALAIIQSFVNGYETKMKANMVIPNQLIKYQLVYDVDISEEDWSFFKRIGLKLNQDRGDIDWPDMVVDFREERLAKFANLSRHHVCELYGSMCGIQSKSLPRITTIEPRPFSEGKLWVTTDPILFDCYDWAVDSGQRLVSIEELLYIQHGIFTGLVGWQGWETYLAAAMGLAVIEILPKGRSRARLSKWVSPVYRMVEESRGHVAEQIRQGMASVEALLKRHEEHKADEKRKGSIVGAL